MRIELLTQKQLDQARPGKKEKALSDGGGLIFTVRSKDQGGGRGWAFRFRLEGRNRKVGIGTYPGTDLGAAREIAHTLRRQVAAGVDPVAQKQAAREAQDATTQARKAERTFREVADAWLAEAASDYSWSEGHKARQEGLLRNHAYPAIGRLRFREITESAVGKAVHKVWKNGAKNAAGRVRGVIRDVYAYAVLQGDLPSEKNFMLGAREKNLGMLKTPRPHNFAALFDPGRVGQLMRDLRGYEGRGPLVGALLRLLPYLAQRPGQVRQMRWEQVDLQAGMWTCPPQIMKETADAKNDPRTKAHKVPMPRQAVKILRELYELTGPRGLVFPSFSRRSGGGRPLSDNTINTALRALGYDTKTEVTGHGFRAMMQSLTQDELGIDAVVADRHLAHKPKGAVARAYDRATLLDQRREMVQKYADLLDLWADTEGPGAPHPRVELTVVKAA